MRIMDIAHLDRRAFMYALFGSDGHLYIMKAGEAPAKVSHLPGISTEGVVKLYVHEPWVCVTERFGTHAALVHMENGSVRDMSRVDYHANVSSYSIGFLEQGGRVLLICQTEWNRLDIVDAVTYECLTDREVYYHKKEPWSTGGEKKNYVDYFHSLLHVSPDGEYFLSNGWIWHPIGQILCFRTGDFLEHYEQSGVFTDYLGDYYWDRPCTFIGNDRFVIAADDMRKSSLKDPEDLEGYVYKQLQFYRPNIPAAGSPDGERTLELEREVFCSAFTPDEYGNVYGELHWDDAYGILAAVTPDGAFALSLEGVVLESHPECTWMEDRTNMDPGTQQFKGAGWHYSPEHHVLYHWSQEAGAIEEQRFGCIGNPLGNAK